jgi:TonB family protein
MPTTPPHIDPELPRTEPREGDRSQIVEQVGDAPVTVVPHDAQGRAVAAPVRIRTNRFGELEEHELVRLLDTIEDERARGRFRESIYISFFIWLVIAWVVFYGPKYLWHSPQLISPVEALKQQELLQLNAPVLHHAAPAPPKIDGGTLEKLRATEAKRPQPAPPAPPAETTTPVPAPAPPAAMTPVPSNAAPALPLPTAPQPVPSRTPPPVVADAPQPQPATRPNFSQPSTAGESIQQTIQNARNAGGGRDLGPVGNGRAGRASVGNGVEVLSDTRGVDFQPYLARIMREIYQQWIPLIPEEAQPPLNKQGTTLIRFTINPDGTIAAMHLDGSTHDDALNRAAWGSITGVGQFPPLPKQFTGPNLELRIHYLVNVKQPE